VLLDTFVVRSLLVPAAAYDIGAPIWWPRHLPADRAPSAGSGEAFPDAVEGEPVASGRS
jgi:RND superfamily putative drug exporter